MPKIFLLKNRLQQQHQRLCETSKHTTVEIISVDVADIYNTKVPTSQAYSQSLSGAAILKHQSKPELIKESPPDSDEPLSLVVNKGTVHFSSTLTHIIQASSSYTYKSQINPRHSSSSLAFHIHISKIHSRLKTLPSICIPIQPLNLPFSRKSETKGYRGPETREHR
ncbi:unnamed protein product [Allacma fusca]|uniref:Uncharacterized protein n=1 Tax=Allacma fusca TaxID=39272 RepID=A0A8J2JRE7_9HEXA|nr:unnamed protein product [Allacma fusca]